MQSKILTATSVSLEIQKTNPPNLIISADGIVNSGGWKNGQLVPFIYIAPPVNGIYEFDFIADRPTGMVTQALTPIKAEFTWEDFPLELNGVKIYSSDNDLVTRLDSESKLIDRDNTQSLQKVSADQLQERKLNSNLFSITNAFVWEHGLEVQVRYGGGCEKHEFELFWDGSEFESNPVQIPLVLTHNNNGDACRSIVTETLQFDLSKHIEHGVLLRLEGWGETIKF